MRHIRYIAVHCTASQPTQSVDNILKYWKDTLHWKTVGYHFLIEADGTINKLLDIKEVSNGVQGFNSETINVCYIGGIDKQGNALDTRTNNQKISLRKVLTDLRKLFFYAQIQGHRDFSPDLDGDGKIEPNEWMKMCPCFDAMAEYKNI